MHTVKKSSLLILASASPRRKELLSQTGMEFAIICSQLDEESVQADSPENLACALASAKAGEVAALYPENWILAADTLVVKGNRILGKPGSAPEAASMLRLLSGCTHQVITGVCLMNRIREKTISYAVTTDVLFKQLSDREISWYTADSEPYDKAGGYAIQGLAAHFIRSIKGSYTNVVGLPICEVMETLAQEGIRPAYPNDQNGDPLP
ncbi:septum formation protein [Desulfobotulus alkaliphilus]|uniref:dTTP/UTP pyrophosphatase n=1 Tax=Desulfobotulus alkaliphilus TaxID=622671 RepID=A0A562REI4_9BACT|nr:Maf family protein [Desulfobotulus alkaliphilus]TWI66974.1 septum formation protein [Desulfobotulus alkaliphilus]